MLFLTGAGMWIGRLFQSVGALAEREGTRYLPPFFVSYDMDPLTMLGKLLVKGN